MAGIGRQSIAIASGHGLALVLGVGVAVVAWGANAFKISAIERQIDITTMRPDMIYDIGLDDEPMIQTILAQGLVRQLIAAQSLPYP